MTEDKKPLTDAERKASERKRMTDQGFMLRPFWIHATRIIDIESIREELLTAKTIDGPLQLTSMAKKIAYTFDGTLEGYKHMLIKVQCMLTAECYSWCKSQTLEYHDFRFDDQSTISFKLHRIGDATHFEIGGFD